MSKLVLKEPSYLPQVGLTSNFPISAGIFPLRRRCENNSTEIFESPCLQMVKVLEKYLHQARSAGCVVTVNRKMKEGMKSSQGIQLQGQQKCQIVVDVGRAETNKEMLVINVISTQATAMQNLHGSKLLVRIMISYQTPTVCREHCCVQGAPLAWRQPLGLYSSVPFPSKLPMCFTAAYKSGHQVVRRYVTKCGFLGLKYFLEPKFITLE